MVKLGGYTFREIRRRPARSLLTFAGIVVGVAAFVSIWVTAEATDRATESMFEDLAGRAALEVVADGEGLLDAALASKLAELPGVAAAVATVRTPAVIASGHDRAAVLLIGIDPEADRTVRARSVRSGEDVDAKDGLLVPARLAAWLDVVPGDTVAILTVNGRHEVPLAGVAESRGAAGYKGGAVAFLRIETARSILGIGDRASVVDLVIDPTADPEAVEGRVRAVLPPGTYVRDPSFRASLGRDLLLGTRLALGCLSVMSLVAGAFIVLNTFLMNLVERRRQIALLRAVGAKRSQVVSWILREAILLGVAGTVVGAALGVAAASGMTSAIARLVGLEFPPTRLSPVPFVLAAILGPGLAVASTWLPARWASRREVLPGLFPGPSRAGDRVPRWIGILGGLLLLGTAAGVLGMCFDFVPLQSISLVTSLMLVGIMLLIPSILPPLMRWTGKLLEPLLGLEGRMALRHLDRYPLRSSLTAGVLVLAIMMAVGMGTALRANVRHFEDWFAKTLAADWFVRGAMPDSVTMAPPPMAEALGSTLGELEGVERVDRAKFLTVRAGDRAAILLAVSFPGAGPLPFDLVEGRQDDVIRRLRAGEAVPATLLALRLGVGIGDEIAVETPGGRRMLRVAGIADEYTAGGSSLYLEWSAADALFDLRGADAFLVYANESGKRGGELEKNLRSFCESRHLVLQSNRELKGRIEDTMNRVIGMMWGLLALVFVVSSLGILNTLTMNVLEQTREIGLLRAVAMTRAQTLRYVLSQALHLAICSVAPGVAAGVAVAVSMHAASYPMTGRVLDFRMDAWVMAGAVLLAAVTAVAAGVLPARRASRLGILESLSYE